MHYNPNILIPDPKIGALGYLFALESNPIQFDHENTRPRSQLVINLTPMCQLLFVLLFSLEEESVIDMEMFESASTK
jgi:hypothetical protein